MARSESLLGNYHAFEVRRHGDRILRTRNECHRRHKILASQSISRRRPVDKTGVTLFRVARRGKMMRQKIYFFRGVRGLFASIVSELATGNSNIEAQRYRGRAARFGPDELRDG